MSRLPEPGETWKDRYEITAELGRGGFGRVYRAWDPLLERDVAVKLLRPSEDFTPTDHQRFRREINIAASLDHRNIVTVFDGGEHDGLLFLVMRFVNGRDLRYELERGPLAPRRAVSIVRQVGAALDYAHGKGLVHRDVKPGNMLCQSGSDAVFLADFGISRRVDQTTDHSLTRGLAPATLAYAAPEQLRTTVRVDGRADVYALGCVLFECLTGRKPFDGGIPAMISAHLHEPPPKPSDVRSGLSRAWDRVIATALAKDADGRFQRCTELTSAAESALPPAERGADQNATVAPRDEPAVTAARAGPTAPAPERGHDGRRTVQLFPGAVPTEPAPGGAAATTRRQRRPGTADRADRPSGGGAPPPPEADARGPLDAGARGRPDAGTPRPPDAGMTGPPDADGRRPPAGGDAPPPAADARSPDGGDARPPRGADDRPDVPQRGAPDPRTHRTRRLAQATAALAVVGLLTWLAWPAIAPTTAAQDATGAPEDGGLAGSLDDEQVRLVDDVGIFGASDCRPSSATSLDGQRVAVACASGDQAPTRVVFRRFATRAERDAAFARLAASAPDGDCRVDDRAVHDYRGATGAGRVVCAVDSATAGLSWTVPDEPILGSARLDDPAAAGDLYSWWEAQVQRDS